VLLKRIEEVQGRFAREQDSAVPRVERNQTQANSRHRLRDRIGHLVERRVGGNRYRGVARYDVVVRIKFEGDRQSDPTSDLERRSVVIPWGTPPILGIRIPKLDSTPGSPA
jgi:hypothetical protein